MPNGTSDDDRGRLRMSHPGHGAPREPVLGCREEANHRLWLFNVPRHIMTPALALVREIHGAGRVGIILFAG